MEFLDEAVRRIAPCGYGKYPYVTVEPGAELRREYSFNAAMP
ncbi:hypothetical protein [Bilophila sp.]